jgi:hypothetical protein
MAAAVIQLVDLPPSSARVAMSAPHPLRIRPAIIASKCVSSLGLVFCPGTWRTPFEDIHEFPAPADAFPASVEKFPARAQKIPCHRITGNLPQCTGIALRIDIRKCRNGSNLETFPAEFPATGNSRIAQINTASTCLRRRTILSGGLALRPLGSGGFGCAKGARTADNTNRVA